MIDRIKLTAAAKTQLATLKRRTGFEHNNVIGRHALCISLANPSDPPFEQLNFSGGVEIDWRTFTGGYEALFYNLIVARLGLAGENFSDSAIRDAATLHIHRGLSYLASRRDDDMLVEMVRLLAA